MRIYIPTLGRAHTQPTHIALKAAGVPHTLVVQPQELEVYRSKLGPDVSIMVLTPDIKGISRTRQAILDYHSLLSDPHILFIDDDFTFYKRKSSDDWHLELCNSKDIHDMISLIEMSLATYPAVGVSMRQGNNRCEDWTAENTAINGVMAFDALVLAKHNIRFDEVEVMEDKHVCLCLLEHGHPNIVLYKYAYNQPASNTEGGCSTFRTAELQKAGAYRLAELHPNFVVVRQKAAKTGWFNGAPRFDVTVYWKKAYQSGLK